MKKCKLIADAGSSKIDWVVLDGQGNVALRHNSDGVNALLAEEIDIDKSFREVKMALQPYCEFSGIYYYGSGCATNRVCAVMAKILGNIWDAEEVRVESDLLGAARAMFGHESGIACILGTGSNSCLYDGEKISLNIPSLGYVLGDEGSGSALGKRLVSDAFKHQLPEKVCRDFLEAYSLTLEEILEKVYRTSSPNKFLASLVPFISKNLWNPYIYSIVFEEFKRFIRRNVAMYPGAHTLPISFMGSIAEVFSEILREAAGSQGYKIHDIVKSPIDGLVRYHAGK
ncbi:MAG: ATPase [Muribaculum sp.]|nr:ATPase [Muribaculum sp.]